MLFRSVDGLKIMAVNASTEVSETGDLLCKEGADIAVIFYRNNKEWIIGLRTQNPNIDVSQLAKAYGGGGHKQASGFTASRLPFEA